MSTQLIERRASYRALPLPEDAFGLRSAAGAVLQHGRLALGVFCAVAGLILAYGLLAPLVYKADALVRVDLHSSAPPWARDGRVERGAAAERAAVAGEIEVLGSREVLLPAIGAAGADVRWGSAWRWGVLPVGRHHGIDIAEFRVPEPMRDRGFTLRVADGRWSLINDDGAQVAEGVPGQAADFALGDGRGHLLVNARADLPSTRIGVRQQSTVKAYEDVQRRLRLFEPSRESGVVRMVFEDASPRRTAALLNELASSYATHAIKTQTAEYARTVAILETQLPAVKARLDAAEQALASYQKKENLPSLALQPEAVLRQRSELERQLTELRIKRDSLSQTLTSRHPDLATVHRQIGTVERSLGQLGNAAGALPEQLREGGRLQSAAQAEQALYGAMREQMQQLRVLGNGWKTGAQALDAATPPVEPVRPVMSSVVAVALGAGLVLALAAALLARALQPTVIDAQTLQLPSGPPILAVIPESRAHQRLVEHHFDAGVVDEMGSHWLVARAAPDDAAVECLRTLHLSLMLREPAAPARTIMITSPGDGAGKSFIAANLAAVMSDAGKRVLLVETDLRHPGLHELLRLDPHAPGLSDLLSGQLELDEVIQTHPTAGLDVILQGSSAVKPGTSLLSKTFVNAMAELRTRYDHVIINAAPMLPSRDALAVGRLVDYALVVVRAERSGLHETRVALRRLEQGGVRIEGLLLNGVKSARLHAPLLT